MSAVRLPDGRLVSGMFDYDRPHRRRPRLMLAPKPTVCAACLTDTEVDVCPVDCPTRERGRQREN